jgi:site-specific DNA recombinase
LANQIERLTQAYLEKIIGLKEYRRRRADLEGKVKGLQAQMEELEVKVDRHKQLESYLTHVQEYCEQVQKGLREASFEQKRELLELLVERIIVSNEQVEIRYVIPVNSKGDNLKFYQLRLRYCRKVSSGV